MNAKLIDWRPLSRSTLRGFAKVQFGSGLIVCEVAIHVAGSRAWASPPSRPWLKDNAVVVDDATGKPKWQPLLDFSTHGVRSAWSKQVLSAVRVAHPEVFADMLDEVSP